MKIIRTSEEFAKIYSRHRWDVDLEVYVYDECNLTGAELVTKIREIAAILQGEAYLSAGGLGDNGFGIFAEDADWDKLDPILAELEFRGCIIEFPDWDEWMSE